MAAFFRRTYLTTTLVAVVVVLWLWSDRGLGAAWALAAGVLLGLMTLGATVMVVNGTVRDPDDPGRPRWLYGVAYGGQFGVAGVALFLLARWAGELMGWVAAGYGLPIAVMALRVLGGHLNRSLGVSKGQ